MAGASSAAQVRLVGTLPRAIPDRASEIFTTVFVVVCGNSKTIGVAYSCGSRSDCLMKQIFWTGQSSSGPNRPAGSWWSWEW